MSFDEFAKRTAGTPEAAAGAAARAAELARKPFADAFVADVYPHWQGPLKTISGKQGIEAVTHGHVAGLVPGAEAVAPKGKTWLVTEVLTVTTHVGVRAVVGYAFAGDENDGIMARVAGYAENGTTVYDPSLTKVFSGPKARLVECAVADVEIASGMFGALLVAALDARQDRLVKEEAAREAAAAEAKRAEEEAKAKAARAREEAEAATARAAQEKPDDEE